MANLIQNQASLLPLKVPEMPARNNRKDIWNQLTFYRDMCSKYGIKLYKSETDEIPGKIIYEDDFQIAVTDEKENLKIDVSEV